MSNHMMSDVVSGGLFLSLYYLSLCVMRHRHKAGRNRGLSTLFGMRRGTAPWDWQATYPRLWRSITACRRGHATPYLQTGLETGLCSYVAWQMSLLMGAWTSGCRPGQRLQFTFSLVLHLSLTLAPLVFAVQHCLNTLREVVLWC